MIVLIWICAVPGALLWLIALGWLLWLFAEPRSSKSVSLGCADCDWRHPNPRQCRWWTVSARFKAHRISAHHDLPPLYLSPAAREAHRARIAARHERAEAPKLREDWAAKRLAREENTNPTGTPR